jgi:hypothetical protein
VGGSVTCDWVHALVWHDLYLLWGFGSADSRIMRSEGGVAAALECYALCVCARWPFF